MTSKLRRWVLWLRFAWLRYHYQNNPVKHPDVTYLQAVAKLLHPVDFGEFVLVHAMGHRLSLMFGYLGDYTSTLRTLADQMETEQVVDGQLVQFTPSMVDLEQLLTHSPYGIYVFPYENVASFKEQLVRVLRVCVKHQDAKVGVHAANRRMLRNFFIDLETLTYELVSYASQRRT